MEKKCVIFQGEQMIEGWPEKDSGSPRASVRCDSRQEVRGRGIVIPRWCRARVCVGMENPDGEYETKAWRHQMITRPLTRRRFLVATGCLSGGAAIGLWGNRSTLADETRPRWTVACRDAMLRWNRPEGLLGGPADHGAPREWRS